MAGRPREFDRANALIKARDLFWLHGYEGTSMSDLVAALGIASARIYHAFGSKEQLFRESIEHYMTHEGGFAEKALENPDLFAAIQQMLLNAVDLYTQKNFPHGCMVVSSATALSEENSALQQWLAEQRQQRTQAIIGRFQDAAAQGQLEPQADAALIGQYYALILHGLSVQARDGASRHTLSAVVDFALQSLTSQISA